MFTDIRYAFRTFLRAPGFTLLAIVTLTIGIGATTAMFSVVNGVLLTPLPYSEPDRIVRLWEHTDASARVDVSNPNFEDWRRASASFDALATYEGGRTTVLGGGESVFADVYLVSEGFFRVFAAEPVLGRAFSPPELRPGGAAVVVVSHAFWEQALGRSTELASITLDIAGFPASVVGVMPRGFSYPAGADVWAPKELFPDDSGRTAHNLSVVGRLKAGVSRQQADAELDAIAGQLLQQYSGDNDAQAVTLLPLHEALTGGSHRLLLTLLAAVGFVLLIACVNVASALLARGEHRRREFAIRAALGAGRARIVRQLLTENLLLGIGGTCGGLLITGWLLRALLTVDTPALPPSGVPTMDVSVMAFAVGLALVTPLLFGLIPSLQVSRFSLRSGLADGARGTGAPARARMRSLLIVAEVSIALVLLVGSALLIRSFWRLMAVESGFDAPGLVTAHMVLPANQYPDPTRTAAFYRSLLPDLRALPGVAAAGATNSLPLTGFDVGGDIVLEDDPEPGVSPVASYRVVAGDYFEALGIPLMKGRLLQDSDDAGAEMAAVVSQDFVDRYLRGRDPIGRRLRFMGMDSRSDPFLTIVGVVGRVRHVSLTRTSAPAVYVSYLQRPRRTAAPMTVVVRPESARLGDGLPPLVRQVIQRAEPAAPVELATFDEVRLTSVADRRFTMFVLSSFAGVALLLAAAGIYGILACSVAERLHEIAIRIALGAEPRAVVRWMLRGTLGAVSIGIALGLACAFVLTRMLQSFLFGVEPLDSLAIGAAVGVLATVAWLAGVIPARRATRVDPLAVLKTS